MPVLTVAGFVSNMKRWDRFDHKWSDILKRNQITSFHMTDFVSSECKFKNWRGKSDRRRQLIADLVECIKQETKRGFAASVIVPEYEEVNREHLLSEAVGQPFALCAATCLAGLQRWMTKKKIDSSEVLLAIEEGDDDQGQFIDRAREEGFKAISFPKKYAQAFQAGDLVGWKCRTAIHNAGQKTITTVEDAGNILRSLNPIKGLLQTNKVYDQVSLLKLCKSAQLPRRTNK